MRDKIIAWVEAILFVGFVFFLLLLMVTGFTLKSLGLALILSIFYYPIKRLADKEMEQ